LRLEAAVSGADFWQQQEQLDQQEQQETRHEQGEPMKAIASALVKAQTAFGPALKSHTNPHFKSTYADLSACIEAVIDSLHANGIALIQRTHPDAHGVTVETMFVHESGESLECGQLHVPASKQDPQGYGSALTYARRYSLMAACGIAPEDDDGNAAQRRPEPQRPQADVPAILRGISGAASLEVLKANFEAAIQMLPANHHAAVTKAKNARYRELTAAKEPA
jgi:hypothetical protein